MNMNDLSLSEIDFCVIDTETTGGNAGTDRIIDVAVFRFRGGMILEKYQTLLNPGRPIPAWISMLTGINDDMVRNAPRFEDVAGPLKSILSKGVFTAHNVRFDYGFVEGEFARLGEPFESEQCCTLRLARRLLPELPSRSLGYLCEALFIDIWDRHRAHGDAEATVYVLKNLLEMARKDHRVERWGDLTGLLAQGALLLPEGVSPADVAALPEVPGIYCLKNAEGKVVFKGRSKNIQKRIRALFSATDRSEKTQALRKEVRSIEVLPASVNGVAMNGTAVVPATN